MAKEKRTEWTVLGRVGLSNRWLASSPGGHMTPFLKCDDVRLARFLLSNPQPSTKSMLLVCSGRAFDWPMVAAGYEDGQSRMEVA